MPFRRSITVFLALLMFPSAAAMANAVRLVNDPSSDDEKSQFQCEERIVAKVEWSPVMKDRHRLRAIWRDPDGRVERTTDIDTQPGTPATWLWLVPKERSGSWRRLLNADGSPSSGEWEVELILDGQPLAQKRFTRSC